MGPPAVFANLRKLGKITSFWQTAGDSKIDVQETASTLVRRVKNQP